MNITIIGGGYVGLVSGVCLAAYDHTVTIVESDPAKVKLINNGECPIYEEGLSELLQAHSGKSLTATNDINSAIAKSDATFIAVGTPFDGEHIDLSQICQAAQDIGQALKNTDKYHLVVVKSTVVPGTTDTTVAPILEAASGKKIGEQIGVAMNPEFLKEGTAVDDFMNPDRIVIGANDRKAQLVLEEIYACFPDTDKVLVNNTSAEMIKYASNSLLATLISFSNEIGNLCSQLSDTDVSTVLESVCLDKRISPILEDGTRITPAITTYLEAGCGFGGSCFPKDVNALKEFAKQHGTQPDLLDAVMQINNSQPSVFVKMLTDEMPNLKGKTVAVLGIAFKPGTDDTRESPAITVIKQLAELGANIKAFDPIVKSLPYELNGVEASVAPSLKDAISGSDAVMLVTSWGEFLALADVLKALDSQPMVFDGRGFLNASDYTHYRAIGVGK